MLPLLVSSFARASKENVFDIPAGIEDEERLHPDARKPPARGEGPGDRLAGRAELLVLHGVHVPRHVVEEPQRITAKEILMEQNLEIRRVLLERFGPRRYLVEIGATP